MRGFLKFLAWTLGIIAAILLVLYLTLFDVWTAPTDDPKMAASTQPTMADGDVVVLARHGTPTRGDLLRCSDPQAPGRFVIARYAAQRGEKVDIHDEVPSIDSTRTPSPHACDPPDIKMVHPDTQEEVDLHCSYEILGGTSFEALRATSRPETATHFTIEGDKIFLISDNRHIHVDSRDYGQIDPTTCQHILFRLWSKAGFGDSAHRFNFLW